MDPKLLAPSLPVLSTGDSNQRTGLGGTVLAQPSHLSWHSVTYVEARPWTMAKGPEHSMASWGGRLLLKSAHWARESCLSETRFLGRQRQELSSEKPEG